MINSATLLGRLARDPDIRTFSNGGKVCRLRLITSRSWVDRQSGETKEKVEGHNIAIYVNKLAERVAEKARKGDVLYVEGPIETRRWTDGENVQRSITEIAIRPHLGTIRRVPTGRSPARPGETDRQDSTDSTQSGTTSHAAPVDAPESDTDPFDDPFLDDSFGNDLDAFGEWSADGEESFDDILGSEETSSDDDGLPI